MQEAGTDSSGKWMSTFNAEKFAELIVRECAYIVEEDGSAVLPLIILKHFGVKE